MKSAPAIIATHEARATFSSVCSSPVARMAFRCAGRRLARKARSFVVERRQSCVSAWRRLMTMSTSRAPAATESSISRSRSPSASGRPGSRWTPRPPGCRCRPAPRPRSAPSRGRRRRRRPAASAGPAPPAGRRAAAAAPWRTGAHAARRVVAGQRGQVHALDGAHQPGGLPSLLHRAAGVEAGHAARHRGLVDAHAAHARQVERVPGLRVSPMQRTLPASTRRDIAPTVSSTGT
jgi:hypothetical protein